MGMIECITPANEVVHKVLRRKLSELNSTKQTAVDSVEYRFANHAINIKFTKLPEFSCHIVYILWDSSLSLLQVAPTMLAGNDAPLNQAKQAYWEVINSFSQ